MSMKVTISAIAIAALVGVAVISLTAGADSDPASLKGKPAPAIELKTVEGKAVSLAAMKGKVVLVDTWATWCPPCKASLPHLQTLATDKALAEMGLVVWAVNDKETKAEVEKFMADNKFTFTVPMDEKAAVLKAYFVSGIPTTIVVGRDGTVKDTFVGWGGDQTGMEIDAAVNKALTEPAPR